jgi:diguanylate cyclase (GGDEF)-like protein
MNGLKSVNDNFDHHAGDVVIRTYLQTVAMLVGAQAEGFRGGSSDEVVVVMRDTSAEGAREVMRAVLQQLGKERVHVDGKEVVPFITASCGVATTMDVSTDAASLVRRADAEQKRAKQASKAAPGVSYLAVEGTDLEKV